MDREHIVEQLGSILQVPLNRDTMPAAEWRALAAQQRSAGGETRAVVKEHILYFRLGAAAEERLDVLSVEEVLITPSERRLVEMLLEAGSPSAAPKAVKHTGSGGEDERRAMLVRDWILQHLESGEMRADMPELLASQMSLYAPRIPFLLYGDYSDAQTVTYGDLKKLLESFFEAEIALIPLMEKEWLILGSESLLTASTETSEDGEEESMEEALAAICSGLYEMLSNEWVGECHVTINYPMTPAKSLLSTVQEMREAIKLGKMYHVGNNLHFPWSMHMEKLLFAVPDYERTLFVEHILRGIDHVLDSEMLSTLEQFFALDCNVSETAKKLYIHRNTLLYRLDKFKQETGKDVRTFSDAVLVKTALLLYKVTKRK